MLLLLACFLAIALAVLITDPEPAGTDGRVVGQEPPRPRIGSRSHCIVPADPPPGELAKAVPAAEREPAKPAA